MVRHLHVSYNDIHNLIRDVTPKIAAEFNPDSMIAIGKTVDYIFPVFSQCHSLFSTTQEEGQYLGIYIL